MGHIPHIEVSGGELNLRRPPLPKICLIAAFVLAAGSVQIASADSVAPANISKEEAEGLIFERQQLMIQLEKDAETLGMIAAGLEPASKLTEITRSIAQAAQDTKAAFQPQIPGGRSKPEVWSNNADFNERLDAFVTSTEKMAKLGESGNVAAVSEVMADALPCKQCHDLYREPKKR
jgi:cytochrome c556